MDICCIYRLSVFLVKRLGVKGLSSIGLDFMLFFFFLSREIGCSSADVIVTVPDKQHVID